MTRAPNRLAAVWKLSCVRVDGSKNNVATTLPFNRLTVGMFLEFLGHGEQIHNLLFGEVCNRHKIMFVHIILIDGLFSTAKLLIIFHIVVLFERKIVFLQKK